MWRSLFHCDNAYRLPAVDVDRPRLPDAQDVADRVSRLRRTAGMVVIEEILVAGRRSGSSLPADVVRERNLYRDGDTTHYGQRVEDAGAHRRRSGTRLKETSALRRAPRRGRARSTPRIAHVKRGLAITPVKFGISFTATFFNQAGALVLVYRDGSVQVNHGGTEMGQGLFTKIQQIAADGLGVTLDRVRRDADAHRQGAEHVGDGGLRRHRPERRRRGGRLRAAARARLRPVAAGTARLRCRRTCGFDDGVVSAAAARSRAVRRPCARRPIAQRVPLFAQGFYRTPDIHFDRGDGPRQAVPLLRLRRRGLRSRGGRLHRRLPAAAHRHPAGRRRLDLAGRRSRPDRRRLHPGRRLADDRRAAVGRRGPRGDGRRLHLQAAVVVRGAGRLRGRASSSARRSPASCSAARPSASRR